MEILFLGLSVLLLNGNHEDFQLESALFFTCTRIEMCLNMQKRLIKESKIVLSGVCVSANVPRTSLN